MSRFRRGRAKPQAEDIPQDAPDAEDLPIEGQIVEDSADTVSSSAAAAADSPMESVPTISKALVPFIPAASPVIVSVAEEPAPTSRPVYRSPYEIQWPQLLTVIILMVIAIGLLLRNVLPAAILTWWPLLIIAPGLLWLLIALIRRSGNALLSSTAILGLGASLLLTTKGGIPVGSTLVGVMFITIGAGILLRGLLLGQQPIR